MPASACLSALTICSSEYLLFRMCLSCMAWLAFRLVHFFGVRSRAHPLVEVLESHYDLVYCHLSIHPIFFFDGNGSPADIVHT